MEKSTNTMEKAQMTYKLDELIEMLGGVDKYYSFEQIMYVYCKSNGEEKEAEHYKQICLEKVQKEEQKYSTLKTEDEIKAINNDMLKGESKSDESDESAEDDESDESDESDKDEKPVKIKKVKIE
jgi:hypothetical protein